METETDPVDKKLCLRELKMMGSVQNKPCFENKSSAQIKLDF